MTSFTQGLCYKGVYLSLASCTWSICHVLQKTTLCQVADTSHHFPNTSSVKLFNCPDTFVAPGGVRHFHCGAYGQKRNFSGAQYILEYVSTTLQWLRLALVNHTLRTVPLKWSNFSFDATLCFLDEIYKMRKSLFFRLKFNLVFLFV